MDTAGQKTTSLRSTSSFPKWGHCLVATASLLNSHPLLPGPSSWCWPQPFLQLSSVSYASAQQDQQADGWAFSSHPGLQGPTFLSNSVSQLTYLSLLIELSIPTSDMLAFLGMQYEPIVCLLIYLHFLLCVPYHHQSPSPPPYILRQGPSLNLKLTDLIRPADQ